MFNTTPQTIMQNPGTRLHILLANERFKEAITFIENNPTFDYSAQDGEGKTVLITATKVMSLAVVEKILAKNAACINLVDSEGRTALHFACALGQVALVHELLKHHANRDARDKNGKTPAHYATLALSKVQEILMSISIDPARDAGATTNAIYRQQEKTLLFPDYFFGPGKFTSVSLPPPGMQPGQGAMLSAISNKKYLQDFIQTKASNGFTEAEINCFAEQMGRMTGISILDACFKEHEAVEEILLHDKEEQLTKKTATLSHVWKIYAKKSLSGTYQGHQVRYLNLDHNQDEQAENLVKDLVTHGFDATLKRSKKDNKNPQDKGIPSIVVDLTNSSLTI